ncbi:MAG TPA: carboxypeptidase-like regulatory domain-containing protein, partial [Candidatus Acidoferrum sp.]|nr:carboxypeptidase-like regulatory domain-containing protein [Candidatus Acidoferrum sp.]
MRRRFVWLVALVVFAFVVNAGAILGQEVTATLTGTVTDQSGAAVAGAKVSAKDVLRGTVFTAISGSEGAFYINRIPVGTYDVRVEAQGFQTALQPGITLVLNQTARLEIQLKVGQATQVVEVTSAPPVLQTDTVQVSTIIDSRTNDNLPLATRNYVQLTLLSPGAVTPNPDGFNSGDNTASGSRPYINGNREQSNNFLLDGMDNNQVSDNLLGYTPAPDAIEEFNLITNNASAEFGNFQGGIVSATIKSGTNSLHGDVWEFFRNDKLNANSWSNNFNGTPKDKLRWNMFGATGGGAILKNKLFFFVDYQGQRFDHPSSVNVFAAYTPAEQGGDFSALCQTGFTAGICNAPTSTDAGKLHVQLFNPCAAGTGTGGVPCSAAAVRAPFLNNQIPIG